MQLTHFQVLVQPETSFHGEITDTKLVHRAVYLFTSQLSLVLHCGSHKETVGLSCPGWLVTFRNGLA